MIETDSGVGSNYSWETVSSKHRHWLAGLLILSLVLRLGWVLLMDPEPKLRGGDGPFYLHLGDQLAKGMGLRYGEPVAVVGPIYPAYLAVIQILLGTDRVVTAARIGQAVLGVLLVALLFVLGMRWRGPRSGLLAAGLAAVDLRFIVECGSISTEILFTVLLLFSLWLYLIALERDRPHWWILSGAAIGVAALTRGVIQLLPLALLVQLCVHGKCRRLWSAWALLLAGFILAVSPWMIRNWRLFGSPKIAHGGEAHFWMGAKGDGRALRKDEMLSEIWDIRERDGGADRYSYLSDAFGIIASDPLGFVLLRARRVVEAYLQPFGTVTMGVVLGDESIKAMLVQGIGHSLREVVTLPAFWPKLWIYVLHFGSIGMSVWYVLWRWRKWRELSLFVIVLLYFSGVYAFLTIIPRYLFPIMPLFILLSVGVLVDFRWSELEGRSNGMVRKTDGTAMSQGGSSA